MSTSTATAYEYNVAGHLSFGAPKCEKAQKSSGFWANRTYRLCIKDNVLIDGAIASSYILLAAEQYSLGACWVHIRNRKGRRKTSDEEIRELLCVPEGYAVLNLIALGGKEEKKPSYTEADFDKNKIHRERF